LAVKVPVVMDILAKQHWGHFYETPCSTGLVGWPVFVFSSLHYFPFVVRCGRLRWLSVGLPAN